MPLVDYSDSEQSDTHSEHKLLSSKNDGDDVSSRKRKRTSESPSTLPPLPESFHDLYATNVRSSNQDDPSLHDGRQRQTPHVGGRWPTHVYIEWRPTESETNKIQSTIDHLKKTPYFHGSHIQSLLKSDLGAELPLHISLSRSLSLLTDQRQPFMEKLRRALDGSGVRPFEASVSGLRWVTNHGGNRWFLVLGLEKPEGDGLNKLLHMTNASARAFGQPNLYTEANVSVREPPLKREKEVPTPQGRNRSVIAESWTTRLDMSAHFHLSIGWSLSGPSEDAEQALGEARDDELQQLRIGVESIKVKIGNSITAIPLASKVEYASGILRG